MMRNHHSAKCRHVSFHSYLIWGIDVVIMLACPCNVDPYTPLLYSKTGVYRGIHYFLIFALKHILWVLVRTHNICFEQKYENSQNISTQICHFYSREN